MNDKQQTHWANTVFEDYPREVNLPGGYLAWLTRAERNAWAEYVQGLAVYRKYQKIKLAWTLLEASTHGTGELPGNQKALELSIDERFNIDREMFQIAKAWVAERKKP